MYLLSHRVGTFCMYLAVTIALQLQISQKLSQEQMETQPKA